MTEAEARRIQVLFIGGAHHEQGTARIAWYRIVLPAMYLGCDWIAVGGVPPHLHFVNGYVQGDTRMARFEDYDVVVIQQPRGKGWFKLIGELQTRGIPVLYEIDDYVHGIPKQADHDFREDFDRASLKAMELCMRRADGILCSTEYIARRYSQFNPRRWVCPNGLDMGRYRLSRPTERPTINGEPSVTIMWAGATGHVRSVAPWLQVVEDLMVEYPQVRFVSIGFDFASPFQILFGPRAFHIPFAMLETYPGAMMVGDIALAPSLATSFHRGKSALRAMEAAALGIPIVADPGLYGDVVEHGQTGFLVEDPPAARAAIEQLIQDESLRLRIGDEARARSSRWDMRNQVEHWKQPILEVLGHS